MTTELASYSSVYVSAASVFDSATSVLATVTAKVSSKSLAIIAEQAKATMSYYSLAQAAATITDPAAAASASAEAAVASAVMKELFDHNSFYGGHAPSLGGNIALLVVMSIFLAMQVVYGAIYRNWWFFTCFICGLILEVLGYCGRIWSSQNIMSFDGYVLQLVCLTLAPCFIMAGIYYTIGEMTIIMGQMYSLLKPMQYSLIFIMCDITALVVQAIGGGVASNALSLLESTRGGADIMVGGLAFQVFSIALFQFFWYIFLFRCYRSYRKHGDDSFDPQYASVRKRKVFLVYIAFISLAVIFVFIRSIYRLIELAQGFAGHLAVTEIYFFILEALMMAIAICLMLITYPGAVYGRNTKIEVDKSARGLFESTWWSNRLQKKDPVEPAEPVRDEKEKAAEPF
ncbi:hypothetical protein KL918_002706 [Ogataea parapolymorpha]|uniref:Sphingoid long-chain base transporter RSB1 n=1 Tax=Ogataea parapolymorpha (strain ATCC 26012 / BCRC 20466 / JCM 22074 / NRRL Y-7560 / DL-1) TaxID=871575 RepID=W1QHI2_OGAPD|nr:hypothetical protein HPODL_00473 [Ogataea parapolymorpha DL-1]ESX01065.1 hypothetical protein HPODL_00473 [Ogataea parapolymorpha DL-1]KAG7867267.1 hypothetical protein KL918_002706 [Ogataea parapolymorpha]KAG7870809.1 hypothetical protein KL916_004698 [Ogataea parapolymorpha]